MNWFIDDLNEYEIFITNGWQEFTLPKFAPLGFSVNEPVLSIQWEDSNGQHRVINLNYLDVADGYAGYVNNPSSAADLKAVFERMIVSGFAASSHGSTLIIGDFTLTNDDKNMILILDSISNVSITIPHTSTEVLDDDFRCWIFQANIGKPEVAGEIGVTVNAPDGFNSTRTQYSTMRIDKLNYTTNWYSLAEDLGSAYDDDALAFFTAVEAITTAFSPTEKGYINDFFQALKAEGSLYSKTDFCHLYMGGDLDHMKLNIVNPLDTDAAHRLETVGSPTIDANGVTTNGSSSYVNLNYNPSVSANQDDTARAFYFRSVGTASNFGAMTAGFKGSFLSINQGGCFWSLSNIFETGVTPSPDYNGFWLINRTSSTAADLSRNDSSVDTDTTATDTNINLDEYIGCRNLNGAANNFSADNFCFDWGGNSLTSAEATALYNAVVALQTALGRNV